MKPNFASRLFLPVFSIAVGVALASGSLAEAAEEPSPTVDLEQSDSGSSCVLVFATVGERFRFDFSGEKPCPTLKCSPGLTVSGHESEPPAGLGLDLKEKALVGVPLRPGFHEYVVLRTEKGVTSEQVVLIDVQGRDFAAGGMEYASYFSGGVH